MKRLLLLAAILAAAFPARADVNVRERPIAYTRNGVPITVEVSTSAWTKLNNTTSFVTDRSGFVTTNISTQTADFAVYCATGAPALGITVAPKLVRPGASQWVPCGSNLNIYGVTRSTIAAQRLDIWEVGQ